MKLTPVFAALLASFSPQFAAAADPQAPLASTPDKSPLPDLGSAAQKNNSSVSAGPSGLAIEGRLDRQKAIVSPEYSNQTGASLSLTLATMLGEQAAIGVLLNIGADKREYLLNAGYRFDERQRLIVTASQLKQRLDYNFASGSEKIGMTQSSGGISYELKLDYGLLRSLEVDAYLAKTPSSDLADKSFAIDSATAPLYELWNDPRRIAGGKVTGLQGKLGFSPIDGSLVKFSVGQEQLSYDLLAGQDRVNRLTGGVEWLQHLPNHSKLTLVANSFASQTLYSISLDHSLSGNAGGRHSLGASVIGIRGRDGLGSDRQFKFTYSYVFGIGGTSASVRSKGALDGPDLGRTPAKSDGYQNGGSVGSRLLDQVAMRPSFIPSHVVAKIDPSALPTRLVAVDKSALPAGSSIDAATGDISTPLGVAVTGIAGVTRNGAAFANGSQFALTGNTLITRPSRSCNRRQALPIAMSSRLTTWRAVLRWYRSSYRTAR